MLKRISVFTIMTCVALLAGAQKKVQNADTLVVTPTPQMHCANCEKKIKQNIRFVKGTKRIETSVPKQEVTIVYDSNKATFADYVKAFSKIGYEVKRKK